MIRGRRDYVAIALATAGVLAAISLAGIFIVYLVDTIGGDDKPATAQVSGTTAPTSPSSPGATSPTGPSSPTAPRSGTTNPAGGGGAGGGAAGSAGGGAGAQSNNKPGRVNLIPDNQQYDTYKNRSPKYSISYPKGWQANVFSTANRNWTHALDSLTVITGSAPAPTVASVRTQVAKLKGVRVVIPPKEVQVNGKPAIKTTMTQVRKLEQGQARLVIDDYRMGDKGQIVTITVRCPQGVYKPNKDDFQRMVDSFRWG
jgi:hypothetical protein